MKPTYPALIRATATSVLELRRKPTEAAAQALIGRLYVIAEGLERGDPAESIAGDPAKFITGDPAEFKTGDPGDFAHILSPDVRKALAMGPDGPFTVEFALAARDTFAAYDADAENPNVPDRGDTVDALHEAVYPDAGDRSRADAYRALYRFWMDAPAPEPVDPDTLPYRVTFQGQAWINGHTMNVDESRYVFLASQEEFEACPLRTEYIFDELQNAAAAPPEVKVWTGPTEVDCERRLYRIEGAGQPTRYADDALGARTAMLAMFMDDAKARGRVLELSAVADLQTFEGLDHVGAEPQEFASHTLRLTVTAQTPDPFDG